MVGTKLVAVATVAVVASVLGVTSSARGSQAHAAAASITIGDSIPQGSDPSLQIQAKALKVAAKAYGMSVSAADANLDLNKQISDVDTLVRKGVKVLAIWPLDGKAIQPALQRAKKAGVAVITQQTPVGQNRFTNLQADDFASGEQLARYLGARLGRGSKVAAIIGPQEVESFRDLAQGFAKGAKEAGLDVVETQTNENLSPNASATFARGWVTKYGHNLKAIFDSLDGDAAGVIPVRSGSFNPLIVTYGGSDQALQAVRDGDFAAVAYEDTVVAGRATAWVAQRAVKHQKTPLNIALPQPLVTKTNIAQYANSSVQIAAPMKLSLATKGGKSTLVVRK